MSFAGLLSQAVPADPISPREQIELSRVNPKVAKRRCKILPLLLSVRTVSSIYREWSFLRALIT